MGNVNKSVLGQFTGTMNYYEVLGSKVTDGVKYLMDNGYSWFVTDFLVMAKMKRALRKEAFLSIELELMEGSKGKMIVTDGNNTSMYKQRYEYTDAETEIKMFFCDNVLMLRSEY